MKQPDMIFKIQQLCIAAFRNRHPKFKHRIFAIGKLSWVGGEVKNHHLLNDDIGIAHLFLSMPRNGFAGMYFLILRRSQKLTEIQQQFKADMISAGYNFMQIASVEDFQTIIESYMESQINEGHVEQVVCRHWGVDPQLIHTKTQKQPVVRARQLSCYLSQIVTGKADAPVSVQFFTRHCGGIHGRITVKALYSSDTEYRGKVDLILNELMISTKYMKI